MGWLPSQLPCWQLVALCLAMGSAWAVIQVSLSHTLFHAIAKAACTTSRNGSERTKLVQQLSEFTTYSVMLCVGLVCVPSTPCFSDTSACWEDLKPVTKLRPELLVLTITQLSAYFQMLITERLLRCAVPAIATRYDLRLLLACNRTVQCAQPLSQDECLTACR